MMQNPQVKEIILTGYFPLNALKRVKVNITKLKYCSQ